MVNAVSDSVYEWLSWRHAELSAERAQCWTVATVVHYNNTITTCTCTWQQPFDEHTITALHMYMTTTLWRTHNHSPAHVHDNNPLTHTQSQPCTCTWQQPFDAHTITALHMYMTTTIWRPLLPIKHPVSDRVKPPFVIFNIRALWCSGLSVRVPACQKLQMTSGLTGSDTGCFIAVPLWQQWASKG